MIDSGDYVLVDVRPRELYDVATPAGAKNAPLFQRVDWSKPSFGKFLRAGALMANGVTPVRDSDEACHARSLCLPLRDTVSR